MLRLLDYMHNSNQKDIAKKQITRDNKILQLSNWILLIMKRGNYFPTMWKIKIREVHENKRIQNSHDDIETPLLDYKDDVQP